MSAPSFYTQANLDKWARWADRPYSKTKNKLEAEWIDHNLKPQLGFWCDQLLRALPGYIKQGNRDWLERDRKHFRHYMWLRLLPKNHNPELYFTIGIDKNAGSGFAGLVIKIDFHRERKAKLTKSQQVVLERMLVRANGAAAWHEIRIEKIKNWEELLVESMTFIKKYESYYEKCLAGIQEGSESYRVARITWNKNGWILPSGRDGKSKNPATHEGKYGYGHEEWLFDTSKIIGGYHYGFLEPIHKQDQAYEKKQFDIGLYSICETDGGRYWIGRINNVYVLDAEDAEKIKTSYKEKGWYDEMQQQVAHAGGDIRDFNTWTGGQLFNIRFKLSDMQIEDYELLPPEHPLYRITRYTFLNGEEYDRDVLGKPIFEPRDGEPSEDAEVPTEYEREAKLVQIRKKHQQIQRLLVRRLREKYGNKNVTWEHPLDYGAKVDVARTDGTDIIYYEIKTYPSIRICIREALGQLLEYSRWNNGHAPREIIIVSDLDLGVAKEYLDKLRKVYGVPINYQRLDIASGRLYDREFTRSESV
jgi:hypothetical protein